ncbi:sigma-70 family RNA polymerase sigma factor [Frigoriglobus tundricola]|uniref:Uncharacterized protein n=1 Tax=Frigoriglobus tundricola TaxID=2774151 RepID=A0A6M5YFW4_9BACT|nr:sigma-70 family RNA polymerase sigma factor [Frigoriglobus tundricola]QJW92939.1 hypothetical protein FTUN_0437 [Frigoriglobus tundricola]
MLNESETAKVEAVQVPDEVFATAYEAAMRHAKYRASRRRDCDDIITDAAVDGLLWARANCTSAESFPAFAATCVRRFVWRKLAKASEKRARRPEHVELSDATRAVAKPVAPVRPLLIDDLPEDIAFAVRLFFTDGYSLRDCGLLMNKSPNTVDLMLKKAAELLAPGRIKPFRPTGQKRLTRG